MSDALSDFFAWLLADLTDLPTEPETLVPTPLVYAFVPQAMFRGTAMDTRDLYDYRAVHVAHRGGDTWAITRGRGQSNEFVWCDKEGEWEYEPQPSSRDAAFLARTRYPLIEALAIAAILANTERDSAPPRDDDRDAPKSVHNGGSGHDVSGRDGL